MDDEYENGRTSQLDQCNRGKLEGLVKEIVELNDGNEEVFDFPPGATYVTISVRKSSGHLA